MPIQLTLVCEGCGHVLSTQEELIAAASDTPQKAFVLKDQEFFVPDGWHIDLNAFCPKCTLERGLPT